MSEVLRVNAVFEADFPEEPLSSDETSESPRGRNVATAIALALRRLGVATTSPEQHEHYGWAFDAGRHYCLLQWPGEWLFMVFDGTSLVRRILSRSIARQEFDELLSKVRAALAADSRFSNVRWMSDDEYEQHARSHPLKETAWSDPDEARPERK